MWVQNHSQILSSKEAATFPQSQTPPEDMAAVCPFSCLRLLDSWIYSPCCSRLTASRAQPVCPNFGAIPHSTGDAAMWQTGISMLQPMGCRGMGSWRWKRCDGMGRDTVLAQLVPAPSRPAGFSQRFPLPVSRGVSLAPKPSPLSPQHELRRPHKPEAGSGSGSECTRQI